MDADGGNPIKLTATLDRDVTRAALGRGTGR